MGGKTCMSTSWWKIKKRKIPAFSFIQVCSTFLHFCCYYCMLCIISPRFHSLYGNDTEVYGSGDHGWIWHNELVISVLFLSSAWGIMEGFQLSEVQWTDEYGELVQPVVSLSSPWRGGCDWNSLLPRLARFISLRLAPVFRPLTASSLFFAGDHFSQCSAG